MRKHISVNFRFLLLTLVPFVLALVLIHLLHGRQVSRSAGVVLQRAKAAEETNDLKEAARYYQYYIGYEPDDAEARAQYGRLVTRNARTPRERFQAFLALEAALRLQPENDALRREIIDVAMHPSLGRYKDAITHLDHLLKDSPEDPELEILRAQCAEGSLNYQEAVSWYDLAIKHDPASVEAYVRLARVKRDQLDDAEGADRLLDLLIQRNPVSAHAYLERGRARLASNNLQGAQTDIDQALKLGPQDPDILIAAANVAQRRDDLESARSLAQAALEVDPGRAQSYLALSRLQSLDGKTDEAIAILSRGIDNLESDEARFELLWERVNLRLDAEQLEPARAAIEELTEANFRPELLDFLKARVLVLEKNWPQAIDRLETVRAKVDDPALLTQVNFLLAACYQQVGNSDQRLAALSRVIEMDSSSVPARLGLASTLADQGKTAEAIAAYRPLQNQVPGIPGVLARLERDRVLRQPATARDWAPVSAALDDAGREAPGSAEISLLRAQVLLDQQKADAARETLAQAVQQHPEDPSLQAALARLIASAGNSQNALAQLDDLQNRLGDTVAVRLARASYWANIGGQEAPTELEKLARNADGFDEQAHRALLLGLAGAHRQLGDLPRATRLLDQLAQLVPDDLALELARLDLARQNNDQPASDQALGRIDALLTNKTDIPLDPLLRLFDTSINLENFELAQRALDGLRRLEGPEGAYWRVAQARLIEARALKAAPTDSNSASAGGASPISQVRSLLTEAASRRPGWSLPSSLLARLEAREGNSGAAVQAAERARKLGDRSNELALLLYRLYAAVGRLDQADELVRELQRTGQGAANPLVGRLAAEATLRAADPVRALEEARKAVAPDSTDFRDHLWLAPFLEAAAKLPEAEAELKQAITLASQEPAPHVALVRFLARNNRVDDARAALEAARAALPAEAAPVALAQAHAAVSDYDQAFEQFDIALKQTPESSTTLRAAASLALALNRGEQATRYLRDLIQLQEKAPDDAAWARRTLGPLLTSRTDQADRMEGLKLLDIDPNRLADAATADAASADDLRARAQALALIPDPEARRAAIRLLERLADREAAATPGDQFLLAQLHEQLRQWPQANSRMLRLLTTTDGDNPLYLAQYLSWLLVPAPGHEKPDPTAAAPWLNRLKAAAPDATATAELEARFLAARGQNGPAMDLLNRFAADHPEALTRLAQVVDQIGTPAQAEPLFKKAAQAATEADPAPALLYGQFLERQGTARQQDALAAFNRFVELASKNRPDASLALAEYHGRAGRVDEALATCEKAAATAPNPALVGDVVMLILTSGKPTPAQTDRAAALLEALQKKAPENPGLAFSLANIRGTVQSNHDEGLTLLRQALEKAPDNPNILNNLAWLIAQRQPEQASEALDLINRAITLVGPLPTYLDTRATIYLKLDRPADAVRDSKEAVASVSKPRPIWLVHLAMAQSALSRPDEAIDAIEAARAAGLTSAMVDPLEQPAYARLMSSLDLEP